MLRSSNERCAQDKDKGLKAMKNMKLILLAIVAAQLVFIPLAAAQVQSTGTIHYEYSEKIDQRTNISPLGDDLFGDSTNFENGATTFAVTDVTAETSVKVPMQLGRGLAVVTSKGGWGSHITYNPTPDIFGSRWDTEVPYMQGDFTAEYGWAYRGSSSARCSSGSFSIAGGNVSSIIIPAHNFHFGIDIKIPGYGKERMLQIRADGSRPSDGVTYIGTTKSNWKISCQPTIKNGTDQGFVVTLPDGAKYYFDWIAQADTGFISTERGNLNLVQVRLYATKAVDRFGGTVEYAYDVSHPHRISQIKSSDGAIINVSYNPDNGKVASVSTGGRTWQYTYTVTSASYRDYDTLLSVILPDASRWTYGGVPNLASPLLGPDSPYGSCQIIIGNRSSDQSPGTYELSYFRITHPSGAIGDFGFRSIMFGYNKTPGGCVLGTSYIPKAYISNALYYKSISGPGITPKTWDVKYYPSWSYASECQGCPTTARTIVAENDGKTTTHVFGNDYATNAGQLLSKTISASGVSRSESYQYLSSAGGQPFPDIIGNDPVQILNNPFLLKNRPVKSTTITQDGRAFTSQVDAFDQFVRPTRITRSSAPAP